MIRTRLIVIASLVVMVASLLVAHALNGPITDMRGPERLQLTANPEVLRNASPAQALIQKMGSFRGLYVNFLWIRANTMKQEGRFHEINDLSRQITTAQPRFAQAWVFSAWNMAYNISVSTHTPEERWMWVENGIHLLRDEGIPANPVSLELYRQLSWIYLHKIGQYADDMHWFYKVSLAREWTHLLGLRPEGASPEAILDWFRPIAEVDETYFVPQGLTRSNDGYWLHDQLIADYPEVKTELDWLRENGVDPMSGEFIRTIGSLEARRGSTDMSMLTNNSIIVRDNEERQIWEWLNRPEGTAARQVLLPYLRAREIRNEEGLDPRQMFRLMEGRVFSEPFERMDPADLPDPSLVEPSPIPLDWRHPATHALYWATLGIERMHQVRYKGRSADFVTLNNDRHVAHSLQGLNRSGMLIFDYVSGHYDQMPDWRFLEPYEKAIFVANLHLDKEDHALLSTDAPMSFRSGHENLLIDNLYFAYFDGEMERAEEIYARLRRNFTPSSDPPWNPGGIDRATRYTRPIDEFVVIEFTRDHDFTSLDKTRGIIYSQLQLAMIQGFGNNKRDLGQQHINFAQHLYKRYQETQGFQTFGTDRSRLALPPFEQMVTQAVVGLMNSPIRGQMDLLNRSRVWRNLPLPHQQRAYGHIKDTLLPHISSTYGANVVKMFPEPPGWEQAYTPEDIPANPNQPGTGDGGVRRN